LRLSFFNSRLNRINDTPEPDGRRRRSLQRSRIKWLMVMRRDFDYFLEKNIIRRHPGAHPAFF